MKRLMFVLFLIPSLIAQQPRNTTNAVPALPAEIPTAADHYSVRIMGNPAGQQAVWTGPDGTLHMFYQFNDRGRGPKTTSILTLNVSGVPVAETVNGNDYLRSPVSETYTLEGAIARWTNDSERGEKTLVAPAIYVSINSAPAELAVLVDAARRGRGKIALLPEGEARIERLAERDLENSGQRTHVAMYAVTGLDFSPVYVWLDERDKLFASLSPWITVISEGWEKPAQSLEMVQDQISLAHEAELVVKLTHSAPGGMMFTHASVFDAKAATIRKDQSVVVIGNRIRNVGPVGQITLPANAEVIDAAGKTLLPGLWDMHAHVDGADGLLNLAAGVTTVRDLGNDTDILLARRKRIEDGREIGTRIILAGIIDGPGPFQGPTKILASTEQEARAAVDNYKRLGYAQIKIYSSVKPDLVPAIIDEAHKNGMRVSGHIPAGMTAAQCVELGYDEIQHANFLMLNFMPDVKNTNTPSRLTEVAKRGADLDLNSPQVQSFIKLLRNHHTILDPTLSIFEERFTGAGVIPRGFLPIAKRLPTNVRRGLLSSGLTPPPGMESQYQQSFTRMTELVGLMYRSGIPIEDGTDSMAGFSLHRELELDVQAGIPARKVLQNATFNAARVMGLDRELGTITSGKLADLILVNGDPVTNISDIRKTVLVVKDGALYKPAELYSAIGVEP